MIEEISASIGAVEKGNVKKGNMTILTVGLK